MQEIPGGARANPTTGTSAHATLPSFLEPKVGVQAGLRKGRQCVVHCRGSCSAGQDVREWRGLNAHPRDTTKVPLIPKRHGS